MKNRNRTSLPCQSNLPSPRTHPVIGVVGGIASGKSLVSRTLERLGAHHVDADRIGHQVLTDPIVAKLLVDRWGTGVLGPAGEIDRQRVAEHVFARLGESELRFLEQVTHPRIGAAVAAEIATQAAHRPVVLDAPLLLEAGWNQFCDSLLFVDSPRAARQERARQRGWSDAMFEQREARQWPLERKRAAATHVIPNTGSEAELVAQVETWCRQVGFP
jgi:dephospho-CoA kinase